MGINEENHIRLETLYIKHNRWLNSAAFNITKDVLGR
jgi:hypothetical protein